MHVVILGAGRVGTAAGVRAGKPDHEKQERSGHDEPHRGKPTIGECPGSLS